MILDSVVIICFWCCVCVDGGGICYVFSIIILINGFFISFVNVKLCVWFFSYIVINVLFVVIVVCIFGYFCLDVGCYVIIFIFI